MNIIDLLLSIFLLLGLVRGLFKGFLVELAGLVALVGGIYAAMHFSDVAYNFLNIFFDWEEKYLAIIAFALTFFTVALLISLAGRILTKMAHIVALGLINRLLGGIFGVLKMAFLASLFLMLFDHFGFFQPEEETKENSVLYLPVRAMAPVILPKIIEEVEEKDLFKTPSEAKETSEE
jgi:membrane protein required for colicin V production